MNQCKDCGTIYNSNIDQCGVCSSGDYSDHFHKFGFVEISQDELTLNDNSFQKCSNCDAYIRTNTTVIVANNLCPICDRLTTPL